MITQEYLKQVLHYDKDTGVFTWNFPISKKIKIGDVAGHLTDDGYYRIGIGKKMFRAHRLAWLYVNGIFPENQIDHINGCRSDNRISNLRLATNSENQQNQKKSQRNNKNGMLGSHFHKKTKKYEARIYVDGRNIYLGLYETAHLAHNAYLLAKRKHHAFCTI